MRGRSLICAIIVSMLVAASLLAAPRTQASAIAPSPTGGFVDSIRFFEQSNQAQALLDLKGGNMDMYTFPLRTAADIAAAHSDPDFRTEDIYGAENNLFVNPVPVNQNVAPGVFNPFELRDVRNALNYLIERAYLNDQLYGGYGTSHAALWNDASPEVARDPFFFRDLNRDASYNFTRAHDLVFNALEAAGATYDGTWKWQGNPIVVNFVIRIEDSRTQIGDYVADQLEQLGLSVNRRYLTGGAAFAIVYNGPPDAGAWMLYTEGWALTQLRAYADSDPDFFYCGGEGSALWSLYSAPPELEDACTRLLNGQYSTAAEREALVESAASLGLNDSVRVWLVGDETFAYSARVTEFVSDVAAGLWSPFAIRTARFASPGGTLQVGQRLQMLSPWNPWQGFGWIYDRVIAQTFSDPALTTHPHTGTYIGLRAEFETTTAGPAGSIDLPTDALRWDSTTFGFTPIAPGTTARSVVNYSFTFGKWHDGSDFTMDDVLYEIALAFRRSDPAGDVYAKDADAAGYPTILFRDALRGFKVISPGQLQVWYDYWNIDPTTIASLINPAFPSTPWTASELALSTVFDDTCRISEVTAANNGREALDLTKGPCLSDMDVNLPSYMSHLPPGLNFDPVEAASRWTALQDFRNAYEHFYVSNGPFVLSSVNSTSSETTVANFASYPFPADHWDSLLSAPIPDLAIDSIPDVVIGEAAQVNLTTTVADAPYDNATIRYQITATGNSTSLLDGFASHVGPGEWRVDLDSSFTSTLAPGTYLFEGAAVGNETTIAVFANRTFVAGSSPPQDTTAPTSSLSPLPGYWQTSGPFHLDVSASDDLSGVASVDLYASYSADGISWSNPSLAATDTSPPFTFSFAPTQGDGRYRFWVTGTDGAGNSELISSKPTTGEVELGLDTTAPTILSSAPADEATGVATTGLTVRVTFSEAVDHASAEAAFAIVPSLTGTFSWDGNTLVFTPSGSIARGTTYEVTIHAAGVTDVAGNALADDHQITFTTEATQATPQEPLGGLLPVGIAVALLVAVVVIVWAVRARRKRP